MLKEASDDSIYRALSSTIIYRLNVAAVKMPDNNSSNSSDTGASILSASPFNSGNKLGRGFFPDADFTTGSARNGVFYSCNHQISHTNICSQNSQIPGDINQSSDRGNPANSNAHVFGGTKGTTVRNKPTSLIMILKAANIINTATDFIAQGSIILTTVGELVSPHNLTSISNAINSENDTQLTTNINSNSFPYSDYVTAYEDLDSSSDDQSNFSITTSALGPTLVINKELLTPLANGSIGTNVTTQLSQASVIRASVILSQNATSSPHITTVNDSSSSLPIHDVAGGSTAIVLPTHDGGGNSSSPIYIPDRSLKSPTEKFQRCLTFAPSLKLSCLHQEIFPFERLCGKDQAFSDYVDELTNSSSYVNETIEIPTTVFSKLSETIERMMANVGTTGFFYTLPKLEVFMSSQSPQSITSFQYEGSIPNTIVNILSFEDNSPIARIGVVENMLRRPLEWHVYHMHGLLTMCIQMHSLLLIRSLNSERVAVHRNLCIAIGLAQIAFLAGIKATHHQLVCRVVALILHYSYTAVFIWMLVEGLHLYTKVVQVFGTEKSRIAYYLSFGWGNLRFGSFCVSKHVYSYSLY
ncbi:hypothetical protein CHS0354_006455 [Potamilus streckersoni]|uniref:G-protein coupled receptors family 2 profile 2 domain-containing protein n=1 Tax=Potamilus streckersoni TaxID=2493646 RepID=A0AAE0T940_9BIVA|nr:hypothetical protein CHS0354_006455 [Potamilus streckersoni]